MTDGAPSGPAGRFKHFRILASVAAVLVGVVLVLGAAALGHCSAFGGRCPAESPPLLEDDVFGTALIGGLIAVGAPVWLAKPGWRRLGISLATAVPVALVIGLLARGAAAG